jgi:hypothetical protein
LDPVVGLMLQISLPELNPNSEMVDVVSPLSWSQRPVSPNSGPVENKVGPIPLCDVTVGMGKPEKLPSM